MSISAIFDRRATFLDVLSSRSTLHSPYTLYHTYHILPCILLAQLWLLVDLALFVPWLLAQSATHHPRLAALPRLSLTQLTLLR